LNAIDWLATPLSGSTEHHIQAWVMWHARCMVLAFAVLMPLGALVARFYKVLPRQDWPRVRDHKAWWHGHRSLQWAAVALMVVGGWLAWGQGTAAGPLAQTHAWAGLALCAMALLQVAGALLRGSKGGPTDTTLRGDHYDMTSWRLTFERLHKSLGWLAVVLGMVVIGLGLVLADAPRWMAVVLAAWWLLLLGAFVHLQRSGRCIDTYQAIWGPDSRHPGNRRQPTGWGVRRPLG
jgi:hypothetical protein